MTSSNLATEAASNKTNWLSSSYNKSLVDTVVDGTSGNLVLTDNNDAANKGSRAYAFSPTFTTGASVSGPLTFDWTSNATSGAAKYTLYYNNNNTWTTALSETTLSTGSGGGSGSVTIASTSLTANTEYRLLFTADDSSNNSKLFTLKIDNLVVPAGASTVRYTATDVTGNVLTDAVNTIYTTDAFGAVDSLGSEGATLYGLVGSAYTQATSGGIPLTGSYGTLTLKSDGSYTYKLNPTSTSVTGNQEVFTYKLVQADGDFDTATLTINLGASAYTAPTAVTGATAGADTITGTNGNDLIQGLAGNDILGGNAGSDHIEGGEAMM